MLHSEIKTTQQKLLPKMPCKSQSIIQQSEMSFFTLSAESQTESCIAIEITALASQVPNGSGFAGGHALTQCAQVRSSVFGDVIATYRACWEFMQVKLEIGKKVGKGQRSIGHWHAMVFFCFRWLNLHWNWGYSVQQSFMNQTWVIEMYPGMWFLYCATLFKLSEV